MYNKITQTDIDALRALLTDPERVFSGGDIAEEYSHDELASTKVMPDVVCKCMSAAEVSAGMKYANEHKIPVTPRGAGTGLVGAAVPVNAGIVIDVSGMDKILELDRDKTVVFHFEILLKILFRSVIRARRAGSYRYI